VRPRGPERLAVLLHGGRVATLERTGGDALRLTYEAGIVDALAGRPVLSVGLPARAEPYGRDEALPFFEGLLPEGTIRERLATRLRKDPTDVFGLLREIGRDCAGAVSILPEDAEAADSASDDVEWLDDAALARHVAALSERPLADDPDENIRISLAGAQDKLVVVVRGNAIGLPRSMTPSTHVLKPPSAQRLGRRGEQLAYPDLVADEAFCMRLAMGAGLVTARTSIIRIDGEPALLVERYDRVRENGAVRRLHQEDFCQALRVPGRLKYEQEGGPGARDYVELVERWSADVATDRDGLIDRIAFNYLIGNADAHAKKFSLLYGDSGMRLAPAYDLVSTHVYPHLAVEMATAINGIFDPRALRPVQFRKWLDQLGVSDRYYGRLLAQLADRAVAALDAALGWTHEQYGGEAAALARIAELVRLRAATLRAVPRV